MNDNVINNTLWLGLHNEVAAIDRQSIFIKVIAAMVFILGTQTSMEYEIAITIWMLWLAEAMLKAYQTRAIERLEMIETGGDHGVYNHYKNQKKGVTDLVREYCLAALQPTLIGYYLIVVLMFMMTLPATH